MNARSTARAGLAPTAPASGTVARGPYPANVARRQAELQRAADYSLTDRRVTAAREAASALFDLGTAIAALQRGNTALCFDAYVVAAEDLADALTVLSHGNNLAGYRDGGVLYEVRAWLRVPDPVGASTWARRLEALAEEIAGNRSRVG